MNHISFTNYSSLNKSFTEGVWMMIGSFKLTIACQVLNNVIKFIVPSIQHDSKDSHSKQFETSLMSESAKTVHWRRSVFGAMYWWKPVSYNHSRPQADKWKDTAGGFNVLTDKMA